MGLVITSRYTRRGFFPLPSSFFFCHFLMTISLRQWQKGCFVRFILLLRLEVADKRAADDLVQLKIITAMKGDEWDTPCLLSPWRQLRHLVRAERCYHQCADCELADDGPQNENGLQTRIKVEIREKSRPLSSG